MIQGKNLEFISFIKRDGSGTIPIGTKWDKDCDFPKTDDMSYEDENWFNINPLSLSKQTYIASGFNSFVVKLKNQQQ